MDKNNNFQNRLDDSYHKQYTLEQQLEEVTDDFRQLTRIQEEVLSAQGSAHFHFREIMDFGVTKPNDFFYQNLLSDIEATTRDLEISFEDQLRDMKKQSQHYQESLDKLLEARKKLIAENAEKQES